MQGKKLWETGPFVQREVRQETRGSQFSDMLEKWILSLPQSSQMMTAQTFQGDANCAPYSLDAYLDALR